ncbi:hypothetical protein FQR65_LT19615 [Abscondita terminalis]|nr:hypothetical protein FQR65_LT19615 [Abscondita terminalis]
MSDWPPKPQNDNTNLNSNKAFEAKSAKAVVLNVNSPGGSPVQSDDIWQEIQYLKKQNPDKKVYAVIGDMGASGAYYIASAADEIWVNPSSLVGSIGVIMPNYGVSGLAQKLGVEDRTMTSDQYDVIYVSLLGTDQRYPIDNNWSNFADQVIDSIVQQSNGRKVIGLGHSLGSVATFLASFKRPDLFEQAILLDPPLIMGKASLFFNLAKTFFPKKVDQITPAHLSLRRRDHWESRQQAAELLRPKGFYQHFDGDCFQAYIDHALTEDHVRGGVTLTIPKDVEVAIFRSGPSYWWLPHPQPKVPVISDWFRESIFKT